jgi:hypothetical protein
MQERLNNIMSALMTDNDRDVSQAARAVHDAFKRTPVRMTGGAGLLDMNGTAGGGADMEAEERQRQEEEADFTMLPDELDRWGAAGGGAGQGRAGQGKGGGGEDATCGLLAVSRWA